MIDEATDVSNSEQVVIVLRWVDDSLSVHEDFIGLYKTDSTTAATLVALIKDVLLRCNISINMCCGQCYAVESPEISAFHMWSRCCLNCLVLRGWLFLKCL